MPFVAVPSVKLGVTLRPPDTREDSATVNVSVSPSAADTSAIVTSGTMTPVSLSRILPVPVSVAVTVSVVPETVRLTVNVSSSSGLSSSGSATVKVRVSPHVPAKVSAAVFAV